MRREAALGYWLSPAHAVFVAEDAGGIGGTYYLRANQPAGGSHVANCGYMTAGHAAGRRCCTDDVQTFLGGGAGTRLRAMQFNFVISTNAPAVHLWQSCGFAVVGRLPGAFQHPLHGDVDALVMYRKL